MWSNVFMIAGLQPGETFLVHGGAGGIGTMAIQLAHALGATRRDDRRLRGEAARSAASLGADLAVNYRERGLRRGGRAPTTAGGADVILDNMGAKYLMRNVDALATEGRLVVIGMQGGTKGELDLERADAQARPPSIATTLRARPQRGEGRDLRARGRARLAAGRRRHGAGRRARPACRSTRSRAAHQVMEESSHIGKILLTT